MRSGFEHLRKRLHEEDGRDNVEVQETVVPENGGSRDLACDLTAAEWSVVSFDEVDAGGLTYAQAVNLIAELDASGIPGLCIITDNAARKALAR